MKTMKPMKGLAANQLKPKLTPTQAPSTVAPGAPGFLLGLWHGFIFPVAWVISLFTSQVEIYAVPNNGGWYDFGYFLGIVVFAAGVCVFLGMAWARYVGAALAVLSAIAHFMLIPYTPIWSIVMIAIDAFIIWALLTPRRVAGEF